MSLASWSWVGVKQLVFRANLIVFVSAGMISSPTPRVHGGMADTAAEFQVPLSRSGGHMFLRISGETYGERETGAPLHHTTGTGRGDDASAVHTHCSAHCSFIDPTIQVQA